MARPRALVLTPRFPWPLDDGGRVVSWQGLWSASRTHDVTLVAFVPPGTERDSVPDPVREVAPRVVRVPFRPPPAAIAALRGLFGRWPYTLARFQDPSFAAAIRGRVAADAPEYALVNHLHLAPYADALGRVPLVLREHNVEHLWMERYASGLGSGPRAAYARIQATRLRDAERSLCARAALVLAIQEGEAAALRALAPAARVETLPIGVDLERFHEPSPSRTPVVLLPASFGWEPNVAGAIRFLDEGWPRVRARHPEARLRVAGKAPPANLRAAAERAGAEVRADVPSMEAEFAEATVIVVPLWVGAGARVKIVEAMASHTPVIATRLAAEGLDLEPETHYVAGETPEDLADGISMLLESPRERDRLAFVGRSLAETRWSLEAVSRRQAALIAKALA